MADLRTRAMATLTPTAQAKMDNSNATFANDQALQASASSEFSRGWNAAGLGEQANKLLWNAASAYQAGDAVTGQQLEAEGRRTAELARTWAPTVQNFTDIDGLGSGAKWAMGALGNVRSSIKPALASMAGGLAGGLATRSLRGAQLGAMAGSTLAGYDQMADETAGTAMMDPTIRATKGYGEILDTARASGAVQAPLEGLVPGAMGAMAMGAGKSLAKAGVKGAMAKAVGAGAAGEFGTEFAQNLVGQGAQNSLKDKGLADDLDYQQALNAGAAGAVAGGAMGGVGGLSSIGHNATDAAVDVATDPRQLIDMSAAAAGKLAGQAKNKIDEQFVKLDDYVAGLNVDPDRRRVTGLPGEFHDERDLEGADIHAMRKPYADRLAAKILDPQSTASSEEKAAATNYATHGDPFMFGDELTIADGEGKQKAQAQSIVDELNGETKKSKMRSKSFGEIDFEVPASSIKESGSPPVTGKLRDDVNPEFTDRAPSDPDVFAAKRESARRQGQEFVKDIPILADIWLKQGIDDRIVKEVSQNVAPAQREAAVAIMSWVARGFKGADGEVLIPESLIKSYGKDAQKLISNAYKLAVDQGMLDPNGLGVERTARDVMNRVGEMAKQYESDAAMVWGKMTPVAVTKLNGTLESSTREEKLSKMAPIIKALRTIANGGEISKAQDAALDSWFGPRKNEVLDHFYEEKARPKQGVDDGQDDEEVISGLAEDNAFAQREEQGLSESTEHGFTKVKEESYYQHRDRAAGAAGEYFDLTNDDHRVALDELKAGRVRAAKEDGDEPSLRAMSTVGYVDREVEKRQHQKAIDAAGKRKAVREYARSMGKAETDFTPEEVAAAKALPAAELTPSERRAAEAESKALHPNEIGKLRREIAERELGITPPKAPGKDAGPAQIRAHEVALREHDRNVDREIARLNKSRVAVRVTKSELPNDLGFTKQDVTDLRLKELNLRAARALVTNGVLVFDNGSKSGNYYATTARKIIAKVMSKKGDAGFTGTFDEAGGNVRLYRILQDGVTSLMQEGGFTRVGYIDRITPRDQTVKPVWMKVGKGDQNFPGMLPIAANVRVNDAREQQKAHDAEQERQSVVERAILQSSGKAMQFLMAKRLRSFMLSDKDYARLGKDDSKAKANHDVASKALADFNGAGDEGVLKQALKELTGSGELHYTPREAGMMVQLARHMLTPKQVSYLRGLKNDLGRKPSDKRFITARDATLKFFDKDQRFEGLKKGTEDAVDWRERALSAINWNLNTARAADTATAAFNETGELEGVTNTLYDITGDDQYNKGTTPSENSRGTGPDDDIQEWGTLRDDPAKAVGTKGAAIHRNDRGMAKGDDDYAAGMLAGAGDSKRLVKDAVTGVREVKPGVQGKSEPAAATVERKVSSGGMVSMDNVVSWLRASASTFMRNVSDQLENDRLDAAEVSLGHLQVLAEMTPENIVTDLATDLDAGKAARLIERAKNVLPRARAIVDAQGGVSDEAGGSTGAGRVAREAQRLSLAEVQGLLSEMMTTRNADTSLLKRILKDGVISDALRKEVGDDLAYLEKIKAGSMESSTVQKTVDGWSRMFAGGEKVIVSRVAGQPSNARTSLDAFQAVIDGERYLVTTGGSSKETSLSTLAHEFGHALQFMIFDRAADSVRASVINAWKADVKAANANPKDTSRFMSGARLSGVIDSATIDSIPTGAFPLHTVMGSIGEAVFNSDHKDYVMSFEEWFAEQFSRHVTSNLADNLPSEVHTFWGNLINTVKKFFDTVIRPLKPNAEFKSWVDSLQVKQSEAKVDPVADWVTKAISADPAKLKAVIAKMTEAQITKVLDALDGKQFLKNDELDADDMVKMSRLYETLVEQLPENKQSKVKADDAKTAAGRHKAEEAAREHLTRVLGDKINVEFVKAFNDGTSGEWTKGATVNTIRLALNSDVLGTAYHESMHEFFALLGKHGGETTQAFMKRVASNKRILNKLSQLLDGQPEAQAQLADPEEALAYLYQFWKAGLISLGPETKSWFQKTADFLRGVLGMVTDEMRAEQDLLQAEFVLAAFDSGRFSRDDVGRQKLVDKINARLEEHDKAMEAVGSAVNTVVDVAGKYVLSAESVVENVKNTYMTEELRLWNQKTGSAMGKQASFFEAVSAKRNQYMNRLENLLRGKDEGDIELARKALSTGKEPTHPPAKELYDAIRDIMDNLFEYATKKDVARLDPETHEWVGLQKRKDYFPQVWDVDALMKDGDEFKALLLKHHLKELTSIAEKANKEAKRGENAGLNTASQLAKPGEAITPEAVAEALLRRVLNSGGHVELGETTSDLGMSPIAAAVNRRELDWINPEVFDAFKSKDLVQTMTSYISSMVKRAEHTDRFGHGGKKTRERAQAAFLLEMGGEKLVGEARDALVPAIKAWRKEKATAMADGLEFDKPFPTLRGEGERIFGAREGAELLKEARIKAAEKLEHAYKAVMAMEGTLGADISDNMRALNSWMMTYQNFRLLSTTLFNSFADVVGLVVNGGELGDAWDAFTTGVKEVKLGWSDKKSEDRKAKRAEMWGTVDAGSMMDALGQTYGSVFLTGTARRMSDALFKWNGMEAWNRAMRITATSVAERVIKQYQSEGFDAADPAAVARFEELFGKGFDPKAIKLDADGELDMNDLKNQAAVSKWVNGAILRPNAAQRTIWGSDPHYQMLWHMKQFTYTFQSVILAKAVEQAKLGNYRPALAAMAGYVPVIIAADAIKELLIPGDEPAWMKSGLAGMLQHGVDRAGLLGIGQMGYDAFATDFGVGLTGPAVSQVLHAPFDDPSRTALRALPFGNLAGRLAD